MANLYANPIPALDPLISGAYDSPAPAIAEGAELSPQHVADARLQHEARKNFKKSPTPGRFVTENELVASARRKHAVQSANFDGPVPAWALQLHASQQEMQLQMRASQEMQLQMRASQQQTQLTLQQTQLTLQQIQVTLQQSQAFTRRHLHENVRVMNRSLRPVDPIVVLFRLVDGLTPTEVDPPVWFPVNQSQLDHATAPEIRALLNFYNIPAGNIRADNLNRLKVHLGINTE